MPCPATACEPRKRALCLAPIDTLSFAYPSPSTPLGGFCYLQTSVPNTANDDVAVPPASRFPIHCQCHTLVRAVLVFSLLQLTTSPLRTCVCLTWTALHLPFAQERERVFVPPYTPLASNTQHLQDFFSSVFSLGLQKWALWSSDPLKAAAAPPSPGSFSVRRKSDGHSARYSCYRQLRHCLPPGQENSRRCQQITKPVGQPLRLLLLLHSDRDRRAWALGLAF